MAMEWHKTPTSRELARAMRASNRVTRKTIDEHRLLFEDLAEIWTNPEETHVVLTHKKDPIWQLWLWDCDAGWVFTSVHKDRSAAQRAASGHLVKTIAPGTYVFAQKGKEGRLIKVPCASSDGPTILKGIFEKLDYTVRVEDVA